jgi:endo-1,4-beta-mannosidase
MEDDDPRIAAYSEGWQASADAIIATPATSMSGIGTKVRVLILELTDCPSAYGEELAQSLLTDVERFAGEAALA